MTRAALVLTALLAAATARAQEAVVLYDQDFERPTGYRNDDADINIRRTVNDLYGGQPPGFRFAQNFTTEVLNVTGSHRGGGSSAFGRGYSDPDGRGGNFVIGMLSDRQDDRLGLSFNVDGAAYLNVGVDVSSIDLSGFSGPFIPAGGAEPVFRFTLFDDPGRSGGMGSGQPLDSRTVRGRPSDRHVFDWTHEVIALDASGSRTGDVILQVDLLEGVYAAFDNLRIAASDKARDLGLDPPSEPEPRGRASMPGAGRAYRD